MLHRLFRKPHHEHYHRHTSIDAFRTHEFRVFYASPFFATDIFYNIKWNKKHLKKLHHYAEHPHKYHEEHHGRDPNDHHHYFKEHVLDSIPFHEKLLKEQEARADFIKSVMSGLKYRKLHNITRVHGGCPDYFVFDKVHKRFFFVIETPTPDKMRWKVLVKDKYRLCDVVVLM